MSFAETKEAAIEMRPILGPNVIQPRRELDKCRRAPQVMPAMNRNWLNIFSSSAAN
jgi:hypothetical protein